METKRAKVFIIDDHPSIAELLRFLLGWETDLQFCGEAANARDALRFLPVTSPDLILLDLSLPDVHGLELLKDIRVSYPKILLIILTGHDEAMFADRALAAGARGYIVKSETSETWLKAMRLVLAGDTYLSPSLRMQRQCPPRTSTDGMEKLSDRELEVFQLLGEGLSTGEISARLSLGYHTVETYQTRIKNKMNLRNIPQLIRYASICGRAPAAKPESQQPIS